MSGRAYISFDGLSSPVSLGTVTAIAPTLNKKSMVTPIPSLDMQSAFPIESGNSKSYSISFKRVNPVTPDNSSDDSDRWSNRKWYEALTSCINRWQARTDGCTLRYAANDNVYLPSFTERGYIKSIVRTYSNDYNEVISGTLQFTVGRMHIRTDTIRGGGVQTELQNMNVMISDPDERNWYTIMYGSDPESEKYNIVDSISISGGPESPFEYATLRISKRKLMEQIPELYSENGGTQIFATKNKLVLDVMSATGRPRRMFVTKVRASGESVTVTAYTEAWKYHNYSISSNMAGTPSFVMNSILMDPQYGVSYATSNIIMDFDENLDDEQVSFAPGASVWRVLQDCAICLGCRLWFTDGCVFVVDLRRRVSVPELSTHYDEVSLFETEEKCCVGTVTVDGEGMDPVANSVTVVCSTPEGGTVEEQAYDEDSIEIYGEVSAGRLNAPEMIQTALAQGSDEGEDEGQEAVDLNSGKAFAQNYISYLSEPQRSITFTFKELYYKDGERYWRSYFGAIAQVDRIIDSYDKEVITNDSTVRDGKAYHKLAMSSYTRKYPQCTCEYSFGVIANIDLSSSTSQINSALGSR